MEFQVLMRVLAVIFILLMVSCRKDVTLKLPEYQQKLVVEGAIEPGQPAFVLLSYAVPYFGEFDYSTPENSFVKGGKLVVTDGIKNDTLTELDPTLGYIYAGTRVFGVTGRSYTLTVIDGDKTYTTSTTIHPAPKLDSVYFKAEQDSLGFIWQKFSEPAGAGDCYRWLAKRLHKDLFYAAPFNSTFNDKFIDGKTFDFGYGRGAQPNQLQQNRSDPERGYYKTGDTIVVKFCRIGAKEYDFWYTYYQNKASNANPFSAPVNVKSMFDDFEHIFGGFIGYGPAFDTIAIPKKK